MDRTGIHAIITGDNRSLIRVLRQSREESQRTASQIARSNHGAAESFDRVSGSAHKVRGSLAGLAGTVGLGGLALGFKDVISAGEAWQAQQAQLRNALQNTGAYSTSTMKRLMDSAESMSTHGGFGASENLQGLTQFVRLNGNAADAISKVSLATNISRSAHRDFSQVLRALMMAEQGRTTGLARLGIAVPKVTSAEDALKTARSQHRDQLTALTAAGYKFTAAQKAQYALTNQITPAMLAQAKAQDQAASKQKVFALLEQRYHGGADAFSKSTAGRISNMRNAWETLQKTLGESLLPVVNKLLNVLSKVFGWLGKNRTVLYALLGVTAAVSSVLAAHAAITALASAKNYLLLASNRLLGTSFLAGRTAAEAQTAAMVGLSGAEEGTSVASMALGAAMDTIPILALVAGIVLLITHWKLVQRVAVEAWKWIQHAASDTWGWIKGHWPLLLGILLGPVGFAAQWIIRHFGEIKSVVHGVWSWIKGAWHTLGDILSWPFRTAWKVIKSIVGWIKGAVHTVTGLPGKLVSGAKSVLHDATFGLLHDGGVVKPKYMALGGPVGRDTVPGWLEPGEGVVTTRGMQGLGAAGLAELNSGHGRGERITIEPGVVVVKLNERVIAEATAHYTLKRAARGSSSLVGGSLQAGARFA